MSGIFKECHRVMLLIVQKTKSVPVRTQLNSVYYIDLHVSAYLKSSSVPQLVLKTYGGRNVHQVTYVMYVIREYIMLLA
jgi:hypothetical protein